MRNVDASALRAENERNCPVGARLAAGAVADAMGWFDEFDLPVDHPENIAFRAGADTGAAAEIAAHAKALGMRDRPAGEYRALIDKSLDGKLSPAENDRLDQLSGARAVEQGLVTQDDLDAETTE